MTFGYNSTSLDGWEVRIRLNTNKRNDTNKINNSPSTTMTPILRIRNEIVYNLPIPAIDVDEDIVKCRWSSWLLDECGGFLLKNF